MMLTPRGAADRGTIMAANAHRWVCGNAAGKPALVGQPIELKGRDFCA